jgi:hypothetical protein
MASKYSLTSELTMIQLLKGRICNIGICPLYRLTHDLVFLETLVSEFLLFLLEDGLLMVVKSVKSSL